MKGMVSKETSGRGWRFRHEVSLAFISILKYQNAFFARENVPISGRNSPSIENLQERLAGELSRTCRSGFQVSTSLANTSWAGVGRAAVKRSRGLGEF
jgi:hypothetical protein